MVDGGTRFALREEWTPAEPFAALLCELRETRSPEAEAEDRRLGGRVVRLPVQQQEMWGGEPWATVTVSGTRSQNIVIYVEDVIHIRLHVERQEVLVQLKARALWSEGYASLADRWLGRILWWVTGEDCTLGQAKSRGWVSTGVEMCADFVGLRFTADDRNLFVGFGRTQVVRQIDRHDDLATLMIGNRGNPISLCIYDKDAQLEDVKGGDDSTYRAVHKAHGWDGVSSRRRVEWRLSGRGLEFCCDETGEVLDLRDPATLADQKALNHAWSILVAKKRLIDPSSSTRRERCKVDDRWTVVASASDCAVVDSGSWRQLRIPQVNAHEEAVRRARRDMMRSVGKYAALHDANDQPMEVVAAAALASLSPEERVESAEYGRRYRLKREAFMGVEIRSSRALFDRALERRSVRRAGALPTRAARLPVGAAVEGSAPRVPQSP